MIRAFLLTLALVCSSCTYATIPFQDEAVTIVWFQTYQEHTDPPSIQWIEGSDLNCFPDPQTRQFEGFWGSNWWGGPRTGECEGGLSWEIPFISQIALYPAEPAFKFSGSSFAHELNHQRLYKDTGDGDNKHTGPSWKSGGLVDQANAALKTRGL